MKNWILAIIVAIATLGISQQGQALAEIRFGYGTQTWDEDLGGNDFEPLYGLNADVLITPPVLGFGFGLRYESLGFDKDGVEFTMNRISLLLNKRLIDTVFYVGVIGSIGFSHTGEIKIDGFGSSDLEGDGMTYTIGAEAGVGLGLISVGAEVGYMFGSLEDDGADFDTAGPYAKAIVSFGF